MLCFYLFLTYANVIQLWDICKFFTYYFYYIFYEKSSPKTCGCQRLCYFTQYLATFCWSLSLCGRYKKKAEQFAPPFGLVVVGLVSPTLYEFVQLVCQLITDVYRVLCRKLATLELDNGIYLKVGVLRHTHVCR